MTYAWRKLRHALAAFACCLAIAASSTPTLAHEELDEALTTATQRIASGRDAALEHLMRGELYRLAGQWKAALSDYDLAAALNPALPGIDLCRAELMFDQGRAADAYAALTRATTDNPKDALAWALRAQAAEALGRPQEAAADLARTIAIRPNPEPDLFVERARLLALAGSKSDALRCLDEGIARLGSIASLELGAADLELERGNPRGAIDRIDRVAAQMQRPGKLLERKASILAAAGDADGARRAMAEAAAQPPRRSERSWAPIAGPAVGGGPLRSARVLASPTTPRNAAGPEPTGAPAPAISSQAVADTVARGPYLQIATPSGVVIRWRTTAPATSRVSYGTALGSLNSKIENPTLTTEHELAITGLASGRRYYYAIGTMTAVLEGNDAAHTFATLPSPGSATPTRVWVIGDAGTGTSEQVAVRDAWNTYSGGQPADVWLMLGDNAYNSGLDTEYQSKVFNIYKGQLRNTTLWPTRGNHDVIYSGANNDYYDIFSMPTSGQAGGLASGTEAYYSFDYGNIHFICLDSEGTNRSPSGAMARWLKNDLAATGRDWVIAYWHHPPYTKGSHDSDNAVDSGGRMRDMRANILPIMDSLGVDLVLSGHSHSYERSLLLNGHYDVSTTLTAEMKIDSGDGRETGNGPYEKATLGTGPREGCVYAVAGSSGHAEGGTLNHPVMVTSLNIVGSMVVDVDGNRLVARFIDSTGAVRDNFTILKGTGGTPPDTTPPSTITDLGAN